MKVLFVCRRTARGDASPFAREQAASIMRNGVEVHFFILDRGGLGGYARAIVELRRIIEHGKYDLVHAHYGLCGVVAGLQRKVPVVTTFHGTDIRSPWVRPASRLAFALCRHAIFVESSLAAALGTRKRFSVIPCGVDLDLFVPHEKESARRKLGLVVGVPIVLFAGGFHRSEKNPELAKAAVARLDGVQLIELRGYTREQVVLLMNAADALLMTSHREGSPQVIKEAMACNLPIVSTSVGDVPEVIGGTEGCVIVRPDAAEAAEKLAVILAKPFRTNGRSAVLNLSSGMIGRRLKAVYDAAITDGDTPMGHVSA